MIMIPCRKFLMAFWLFLISVLCHAASKSEPKAILLSPSATSIERLAADEVQKHIYLRTKTRLPVLPSKSGKSKTAIRLSCDSSRLSPESFRIDRDEKGLHIVGGSDVGLLYGVYQYAELLGVVFTLHGDIIPDEPYEGSLLVSGKGNLARFDYWLHTFEYLRTMGQLGCLRGKMDRLMSQSPDGPTIEKTVLPLRIELARTWERLIEQQLQTISTIGEVGTLINLESQTRKTYGFLTKHDAEIVRLTKKPLPAECHLSMDYRLSPQLVVLNHRELLEADEPYRLELTIPGKTSADEAPCLHYRQLGKGSFKTLAMQADDAHHFSVTIPQTLKGTIEYYISFKHHGSTYHYPAAAPSICATWVKLSVTEGCVNTSRKD